MKGKQLTNEDVVKAMYDLVGDEYTKLDDKYVKNDVKFKIRHEKCGYEFETTWKSFKKKQTCANCSGRRKYTDSEINNLIHDMTKGEYTKLSTYKNASTKFRIKHNLCGHEYEVNWNNFQSGKRCPKCAANGINYTNEEIVQKIYELVGDEYTKLDNTYINSRTKFLIRHELCGHEYETKWTNFQRGCRCPKCTCNVVKYDNEMVINKISDLVGNEYTKLDDNYVNSETKFSIRHELCGHEYSVSWDKFKQGNRCPRCNQPKGERFIEDYLTNHNISFSTQVKFNDCKYINTLPFDFGIVNKDNNKIIALIEFDGRQHFEPIEAWGGEENLKLTQLRDSIKDEFCKDNNIPLLRIRYDENIEEKLNLFLAQERVKA